MRVARGCLLAPVERLLPLRQMGVEVAHIPSPPRHFGIVGAQAKCSFDARKAVLAAAEKHLSISRSSVSDGIVIVLGDSGLGLGDRRRPLFVRLIDEPFFVVG